VRAGSLDRRVILQRPTKVREPNGAEREVWLTVDEVWAGKKDATGRERIIAGTEIGIADAVFTIRWREDVTSRHRVRYLGKDWRIIAPPAEVGRKEGLQLVCQQIGAQRG
jgi:SPP1 family predicted phage head-tail adaptor